MNENFYESPCIDKIVVLLLEHTIADSTNVDVGDGFTESWEEERIDMCAIVLK